MKFVVRFALAIVALISAFSASRVRATPGQPGSLDTTWGGTGTVIAAFGNLAELANTIALQPDGKVLLAGQCYNGSSFDFCAMRFSANGTLDPSWNGTGRVIATFGSATSYGYALTVQPDGKVVLAGTCVTGSNSDFCVARYLANGTLDPTWNGTGTLITAIGSGNDAAYALALQPDGKLLLAGYCFGGVQNDFCTARYLPNGVLDPSWGGTGTIITSVGTGSNGASALTLQPDGKVLLAGACFNGSDYDFCSARYLPNGVLDGSWGGTGTAITPVGGGRDLASAIALQPDGKVLLAGRCTAGTERYFCTTRHNSDGSLDVAWNGTGKVVSAIGGDGYESIGMFLQPDGKVLLGGACRTNSISKFCVARYNTDGVLDTTWNGTGIVSTVIGYIDNVTPMSLQPDGRVLLAGYCVSGLHVNFCAARYEGGPFGYKNCSLDIDGDGQVLAMTDSLIHARIALGITGDAVVAGITFAAHAQRKTWAQLQPYLVSQCGMSLPPP